MANALGCESYGTKINQHEIDRAIKNGITVIDEKEINNYTLTDSLVTIHINHDHDYTPIHNLHPERTPNL